MVSMLCSLWDDFSLWVTNDWSQLVFIFVVGLFGIFGLMGVLSFLKGPKYNKEKKPFKWGVLVMSILMFALMGVVLAARFA